MSIVIDVKVNSRGTNQKLDKLQATLAKLESQYKATSAAASQFSGVVQTQTAKAASASGRAGSGSKAPPRLMGGPSSRLFAAQARLAQAQATGDPSSIFDAQYALNRAQAAHKRAASAMAPPDPVQDFIRAMMRTRFSRGMFGGLKGSPLGIDIHKLGGMGSPAVQALMGSGSRFAPMVAGLISNPIVAGAVAAVAVASSAIAFGVGAARSTSGLSSGFARYGGTRGDWYMSNVAGRMFGGDPRSFQDAISNGIGAGYASRAGINIRGGPFGDMDYASKYRKYSSFVANSGSFEEARRRAEAVGMPDMAKGYWLSPRSKRQLADRQGAAIDPYQMRQSAEYDFQMAKAAEEWEKLKRALGSGVMPTLTRWIEGVNRFLDGIGRIRIPLFEEHKRKTEDAWERTFDWLDDKLGGKSADEQRKERHAKAMDEHSRAMKEHREILGGDKHAEGAIPRNVRGWNAEDAMSSSRINAM